ncbi:hypothetical protein [Prevotella sp. oral taxon 376]|uniref:hypothetical protein n=1 Tax=Prevotella sp. oral taxon 376 TaxID=712466 RepID=UPI0011B21F8D|nr:hypothetical protein [Prevotella sp. oral taxon 376]
MTISPTSFCQELNAFWQELNRAFNTFMPNFAQKSKGNKDAMGYKKKRTPLLSDKNPDPINERMGLLDTIKAMVEKEVKKQLGIKKEKSPAESQNPEDGDQPP